MASNEYFKVVKKKDLKSTLVSPVFKEYKNGAYKNIGIFSKQARGLMTDFIIKTKSKIQKCLKLLMKESTSIRKVKAVRMNGFSSGEEKVASPHK
ncbi:UPF0246 protein YaaA [Cyclobacterium qasimii M12-11B]|uniref:UPF0246 protein YaaA n=1 Tax=Cyclobacterium qasimii M12-11B TaxID=641524 RepID=S7WNX9_9BACT|nr:UPF0246 protein YaaA [Cyclobacterium qasimii M12-11B]